MGGVARARSQKRSQMQAIKGSFSINVLRMIIKLTKSQTSIYYYHAPPILSQLNG